MSGYGTGAPDHGDRVVDAGEEQAYAYPDERAEGHPGPDDRSSGWGALWRRSYVTWALLAINLAVFGYLHAVGPARQDALLMYGPLVPSQPWRLLTAVFAHYTFVHIATNMFMLVQLGPPLEIMLGRARFAVLYLLSGLGGSLAVWLLAPDTYTLGASGAILGMVGALVVITRATGGDLTSLVLYLVVTAWVSFTVPNVSWQGHLGGFVTGLIVSAAMVRSVRRRALDPRRR